MKTDKQILILEFIVAFQIILIFLAFYCGFVFSETKHFQEDRFLDKFCYKNGKEINCSDYSPFINSPSLFCRKNCINLCEVNGLTEFRKVEK